MSRIAVEHVATESAVDVASYDSTKWNTTSLIRQRSDLTPPMIGPVPPAVCRPVEDSDTIPGVYPHAIQWSADVDWVLLCDNAAAAATRRFKLKEFHRDTGVWANIGFITVTFPSGTNFTLRGARLAYDVYTAGTVAVSGTAVTGTSTLWSASSLCVGNRIGFGSTDPTQISTWYEISAIGSDTSITLTATAGTIAGGTAYCIEDLRIVTVATNATTTNGGLFVIKGLRYETFAPAGTAIAAAVSTDSVRACYWLADASTVTDIGAAGMGMDARSDWVTQNCYVLDTPSAGNYIIYKYNIRKALTVSSGKDTTTLVLKTGTEAVTGTVSQTNNGAFGTLNHGPTSGVKAFYFVTTSRIYAAVETDITSASTTFIGYTMTEVPPGSVNSFAATGALASVVIINTLDRLAIMSSGATGLRSYISQFRTDAGQMDAIFTVDDKQMDQSSADATLAGHMTTNSVQQSSCAIGGMFYTFGVGTTATTNIGRAFPMGVDWGYTTGSLQRLITPVFTTPNNNHFWRAHVNRDDLVGGDVLGTATQPLRLLYRTAGISDNSGTWTSIPSANDLSGVSGATEIQFAAEFRIISDTCMPSRVLAVTVTYEDNSTDSHWQFSAGFSDKTAKRFAWRFASAYGGTVPRLQVTLFDAVSGFGLLVDDSVTQGFGTWEKSTDGGFSWAAYNTTDKANETTYLRFTPNSLADSVNVASLLSLY